LNVWRVGISIAEKIAYTVYTKVAIRLSRSRYKVCTGACRANKAREGRKLPFWKREGKKCEFCGKNDPTRKVQMPDGQWKLICESCWMEKKIHPYLII